MPIITTTILIDGKIEIPEATRRSKQLGNGVRLQVIETADGILLRKESALTPPVHTNPYSLKDILAENDPRLGLDSSANHWRSLEGILADDGINTSEEKQREREMEETHDRQKFGISAKR